MTENTMILRTLMSAKAMQEMDMWVSKYPEKKSAVMSLLRIAQEEHGYLTVELMDAIAQYLAMPYISVYEVATFYSMYKLKPQGKHTINVCTNISCKLRGSDEIMQYIKDKFDIEVNETTKDGQYTLKSVECLGACVGAPMFEIDKVYYENLDAAKMESIFENLTQERDKT